MFTHSTHMRIPILHTPSATGPATCLGASMVCIAVYVIAHDLPISDETGLVAEGVCSIGILIMCVRYVNVFIVVEELWEGFETAKCLPCAGLLGVLYAASST